MAKRDEGAGPVVYDVDGLNPYGRELAALLAPLGQVTALLAADTSWLPDRVQSRRVLPANGPAPVALQALRLLRGWVSATWLTLVQRRLLLVVLTRGWYDDAALAVLAGCGAQLVVVAHDPVPKTPLSRRAQWARSQLWRRAHQLVAHSQPLARELGELGCRRTAVVHHLPFLAWARWAHRAVGPPPQGSARLLVMGHLRADKGLDRLAAILRHIPATEREGMSLAFACRGPGDDLAEEVGRLVRVTCRPSDQFLSDRELARRMVEADVLIAPYRTASASGTVVLALSMGLRVVAYDVGSLSEVLGPESLVPAGDEAGFAARVRQACRTTERRPAQSLEDWAASSFVEWSEVVHTSGAKPLDPSPPSLPHRPAAGRSGSPPG